MARGYYRKEFRGLQGLHERKAGVAAPCGGNERRTVVPWPGRALSTWIVPACAVTMAWAIASPSPAPPVRRLRDWSARYRRSNRWGRSAPASIPAPSSDTVSATLAPEQMGQIGAVDSGAVVGHRKRHPGPGFQVCRRRASMLQRVVQHVAKRLTDPHAVELQRRESGAHLQ